MLCVTVHKRLWHWHILPLESQIRGRFCITRISTRHWHAEKFEDVIEDKQGDDAKDTVFLDSED